HVREAEVEQHHVGLRADSPQRAAPVPREDGLETASVEDRYERTRHVVVVLYHQELHRRTAWHTRAEVRYMRLRCESDVPRPDGPPAAWRTRGTRVRPTTPRSPPMPLGIRDRQASNSRSRSIGKPA